MPLDHERYELIRVVGRGAAGDVYLARDRLRGDRPVALKRIRAAVDELVQRAFEREFATMANLSLPGIAPVFDFGVLPARGEAPGGPFFTRAFIDGQPLQQACEELSTRARIAKVADVGAVIAPLHAVGVIHGDIKPGNVIIDGHGQAHVIDFGLARVVGARHRRAHDMSEGAAGTPPYMAPELLRGEPPSARADIYALGATLWCVLLSEPPFAAGDLSAKLRGHAPLIPEGCDDDARRALAVARRALAPDPLDRFPTIDEFVVALDELVHTGPRQSARGFVPPRPRGQLALVDDLEASVGRLAERGSGVIITGAPAGGGKTSVLRELKWRLQLRGYQVLEVPVRGSALAPLWSLIEHVRVMVGAADDDPDLAAARSSLQRGVHGARLSDALASLLGRVAKQGPIALLIDDVDATEAVVGAVLRALVHAEMGGATVLVASATDPQAPAPRELSADETRSIAPLERQDVSQLARDALGPIDDSVSEALWSHTRGLPGALLDALAQLHGQSGISAADVEALEVGAVALSLAAARIRGLPADCRRLLQLLSLAEVQWPRDALALVLEVDTDSALRAAEEADLVSVRGEYVSLDDQACRQALRAEMGDSRRRSWAAALLADARLRDLAPIARASLAVVAGEREAMTALIPEAGRELAALGAHASAARLYEALLPLADGELAREVRLALARCYHELGDYEASAGAAGELLQDDKTPAAARAEAALQRARALTSLGRLDEAVSVLETAVTADEGRQQASVQRELAKIHLRRGDYDAVARAAQRGLECAEPGSQVRIELLTSSGVVATYRGDHETARQRYNEALDLGRALASRRDEANVLTYLALDHQRAGELEQTRDLMLQSMEAARELGDIGSMSVFALNLGAVLHPLGEHVRAERFYQEASTLAKRAGRTYIDLMARNYLANIHIYFGLYERARVEVGEVLERAKGGAFKLPLAFATAQQGMLGARAGRVDEALSHYDDAIRRFEELGQSREVAEYQLDAAEALLDRDGPSDVSAAAARLSEAHKRIEREPMDDLALRLELLRARARFASREVEGALAALDDVIKRARHTAARDVEWQALSVSARAHEAQGADFVAQRYDRTAAEVLEDIALHVPREHRDAFWQEPARREARARARQAVQVAHESVHALGSAPAMGETKSRHLLEIIKRLACEHNVDRLLERITESAVDLSGAERGFVLLVDEHGALEPRTLSSANPDQDSAHAAFSRSIAEAVLIDGEPIVTVDATDDRRLSEYVSVHQLMLRSVACLPIRGRGGTVGVLYLEHRRRRSLFSEADVELLFAFADQAAIALENARLLEENRLRQQQLQSANEALAQAKQDIEELLVARTEELEEARRELQRTRRAAHDASIRHGMVGRSAAMRAVFDTIDRVMNANVPVVIHGESGTGKELVARAIHYGGPRAKKPFVALNCASLPPGLLESELFGHVRGAFTGADRDRQGVISRAASGTLLLDEVGDMPMKMQIDLLRVLQEGTFRPVGADKEEVVDARFVAISRRPLEELVAEGSFREDLFYRLNVVEIGLPPLRERPEDIPLLCEHFLRTFAERDGKPAKRLGADAARYLGTLALPGNVRQLEHLLLNAWVMHSGRTIDAQALQMPGGEPEERRSSPPQLEPVADSPGEFREEERQRILRALEHSGWNRARAAQALGIARRTFYRRLREYQIL